MIETRVKKSVRNVAVIFISKIFQMLLTFLVRTLVISYLGDVILGLDGLFSSIITVLSIADLGLGSAVMFSLYEPIANHEEKRIAAYISFFDKVYSFIGVMIFAFGVITIPVLKYLIILDTPVDNIAIIYLLTIFDTAVTYFFASRRVIFEADQSSYKITTIDLFFNVGLQLTQIFIILITGNYILVLSFRAVWALLNNLLIYHKGNAYYKYLKIYKNEKLGREEIKSLWANIGYIFCHKVGGVLVSGVDNTIISAFVSTLVAGYYSNYLLIINSITSFITIGLNALIPSVGNLKATTDDVNHHYRVFKEVVLINYILSAFAGVMLLAELNNFISVWIGKDYLLENNVVLLLCLNFYISTMRYGCGAFNTAAGYFKQTIIKPIAEGILNLVVSITLVQQIGIIGVFFGTLASLLLGSVWVDPYIIHKYWFKRSIHGYTIQYIFMLGMTVGIGAAVCSLGSLYMPTNFIELFLHGMICAIVCGLLVLVTTLLLPGRKEVYKRANSLMHKGS